MFYVAAIAILAAVTISAARLKKKYPAKPYYLFPGGVLTAVSLAAVIWAYFTGDGWSLMGYSFLFVFAAAVSIIGTAIGRLAADK